MARKRTSEQKENSNDLQESITPYVDYKAVQELQELHDKEFHLGDDGDDEIAELGDVKQDIIWVNLISISLFHIIALYSTYITISQGMWKTILFQLLVGLFGGFGVTGGAHRYWTHRSYKAKLPLRIILMLAFTTSGQNTLYDWVRDHRVHHKFSETDADPHNIKRGFFFAHVGWLMMRKHPEVVRQGKKFDYTDILSDPVVQFHQKYFKLLKFVLCFIIPTMIPVYLWNETWANSIHAVLFRYVINLNGTWLVNSAAHTFGNKPFDRRIAPTENFLVAFLSMGEGWHNYHHVFPWDYKTAELCVVNLTTRWIELFAKIGWAYDLKTVTPQMIKAVSTRLGDGSHSDWGHKEIPEDFNFNDDVQKIEE